MRWRISTKVCFPTFLQVKYLSIVLDGHPPQSEPSFVDSSWPLFAMYSKIAEEEDTRIAERWQKDAEGIILFVCPSVSSMTVVRTDWKDT